jgi:hypothetical protein
MAPETLTFVRLGRLEIHWHHPNIPGETEPQPSCGKWPNTLIKCATILYSIGFFDQPVFHESKGRFSLDHFIARHVYIQWLASLLPRT